MYDISHSKMLQDVLGKQKAHDNLDNYILYNLCHKTNYPITKKAFMLWLIICKYQQLFFFIVWELTSQCEVIEGRPLPSAAVRV